MIGRRIEKTEGVERFWRWEIVVEIAVGVSLFFADSVLEDVWWDGRVVDGRPVSLDRTDEVEAVLVIPPCCC